MLNLRKCFKCKKLPFFLGAIGDFVNLMADSFRLFVADKALGYVRRKTTKNFLKIQNNVISIMQAT